MNGCITFSRVAHPKVEPVTPKVRSFKTNHPISLEVQNNKDKNDNMKSIHYTAFC